MKGSQGDVDGDNAASAVGVAAFGVVVEVVAEVVAVVVVVVVAVVVADSGSFDAAESHSMGQQFWVTEEGNQVR